MQGERRIQDLRAKVARFHGRRKVMSMARLAESLLPHDHSEALELAVEAVDQARKLCANAHGRGAKAGEYLRTLAYALTAHASCLEGNFDEELHPKLLREACDIFESLRDWDHLLDALERTVGYYRLFERMPKALQPVERALHLSLEKRLYARACAFYAARAVIHLYSEKSANAEEDILSALELLTSCKNSRELAGAHYAIAEYYFATSNYDTAVNHYSACKDAALKHGDNRIIALLHIRLTSCYTFTHQQEKHTQVLVEGYVFARSSGVPWIEGTFCHNLGVRMRYLGKYDLAITYFLRAREIFKDTTEKVGLISIEMQIGQLYMEFDEQAKAYGAFRRTLDLIKTTHARISNIASIESLLRYDCWPRAEIAEMRDYILSCKNDADVMSRPNIQTVIGTALGVVYHKLDEVALAEAEFRASLKASQEQPVPSFLLVRAQVLLADLYCEVGRLDEAATCLLEAEANFDEVKYSYNYFKIKQVQLELHKQRGDFVKALDQLEELREDERRRNLERNRDMVFKSVQDIETENHRRQLEEAQETNTSIRRELAAAKRELRERDLRIDYINNLIRNWKHKLSSHPEAGQNPLRETSQQILQEVQAALSDTIGPAPRVNISGSEDFVQHLASLYPTLTQAECKVCALIKSGSSTKEIANHLRISARTVETNRYRIRRKMLLDKGSNLNSFIRSL